MNSRDRQFWTEFLTLYRSLPAVWKIKSPEYSSRVMKSAGYEQLVKKLREVEPLADRALVVKKINSFRTNFRRDLRKLNEGQRQALDEEKKSFESTLWYFELLDFLKSQESPSLDQIGSPKQKVCREGLQRAKKRRSTAIKRELNPPPINAPASSVLSPYPLANQAQHTLSEAEALSHTWRSQFDELAPRQKLLARKLISDVLYYGCLGQLQSHHVTQFQQLMLQPCRTPSPQIEDVTIATSVGQLHVDILDEKG